MVIPVNPGSLSILGSLSLCRYQNIESLRWIKSKQDSKYFALWRKRPKAISDYDSSKEIINLLTNIWKKKQKLWNHSWFIFILFILNESDDKRDFLILQALHCWHSRKLYWFFIIFFSHGCYNCLKTYV